jgi:hypothetical protein
VYHAPPSPAKVVDRGRRLAVDALEHMVVDPERYIDRAVAEALADRHDIDPGIVQL